MLLITVVTERVLKRNDILEELYVSYMQGKTNKQESLHSCIRRLAAQNNIQEEIICALNPGYDHTKMNHCAVILTGCLQEVESNI